MVTQCEQYHVGEELDTGVTPFQAPGAFFVTDPVSWAKHRPIPKYRHAGNFRCRSNVARGSPSLFTEEDKYPIDTVIFLFVRG